MNVNKPSPMHSKYYFTLLLMAVFCTGALAAGKESRITVEDELKQLYRLELLPHYRQGIVEQESSYDRTGGNDDGFSGKYSSIRREGNTLVLADLKGAGVINRIWT
ncbi:MAG: hypothetical protein LBV41_07090, partial [Cytophagaceae bacterium]|nr:hypothetical protein [Cytophagaceae bacterium]